VLAGVLLALSIGLVLLLLTVPGRALQADGYYLWLRSRSSVSAEKQVEHLSHILRLAPGHAQATVELGNISAQSGDPEKAAQYYEPVVDLHGAGANNLAVLRLEEGEPAQALEALQVAVFLEPDVASIYQNLGAAQWATGHEQESLRSFREALRVDPTLIMARYHLGLDHLHHRDLARAAAAFERILEQDMTCAPAYLGLGLVQREVGDLRRAADAFGQATLYDPSSVIARFHLGWAQMEMGCTAAAQSALAAVLERDPDRALADRVRILLAEGRSTFNALLPEREW
jgi:tetratricopeptide (TPR) repeat protein